jgi:hypothetical protein
MEWVARHRLFGMKPGADDREQYSRRASPTTRSETSCLSRAYPGGRSYVSTASALSCATRSGQARFWPAGRSCSRGLAGRLRSWVDVGQVTGVRHALDGGPRQPETLAELVQLIVARAFQVEPEEPARLWMARDVARSRLPITPASMVVGGQGPQGWLPVWWLCQGHGGCRPGQAERALERRLRPPGAEPRAVGWWPARARREESRYRNG